MKNGDFKICKYPSANRLICFSQYLLNLFVEEFFNLSACAEWTQDHQVSAILVCTAAAFL